MSAVSRPRLDSFVASTSTCSARSSYSSSVDGDASLSTRRRSRSGSGNPLFLLVPRGPRGVVKALALIVLGALVITIARTDPGDEEGLGRRLLRRSTRRRSAKQLQRPPASLNGTIFDECERDSQRLRIPVFASPARPGSGGGPSSNLRDRQLLAPALSEHIPSLFSSRSSSPGSWYSSPSSSPPSCSNAPLIRLPLVPISKRATSASRPELWFSICTSPSRAAQFGAADGPWSHFMRPHPETGRMPGCVVTDAEGSRANNLEGHSLASEALAGLNARGAGEGGGCKLMDSAKVGERYEMRVLGLIRDAWVESEQRRQLDATTPAPDWFVFMDDDTFWTDITVLQDVLANYDPRKAILFGSTTEAVDNLRDNGHIAYGGAGIIISREGLRRMQPVLDRCVLRFGQIPGGDGMITHCAALAFNVVVDNVVTEISAMRQMDLKLDASGYIQSGAGPFLSLHHWASWLSLFPEQGPFDAIKLVGQAADVLGGRNLFRRYMFDGGHIAWTLGYSITVHKEALTKEEQSQVEHTWNGYHPRPPSREPLLEGADKITYYLKSIESLGDGRHIFRHETDLPRIAGQGGLKALDVVWQADDGTTPIEEEQFEAGGSRSWRNWWPDGVSKATVVKKDQLSPRIVAERDTKARPQARPGIDSRRRRVAKHIR